MQNKEIIKRVDKAIEELIAIKVSLSEGEQQEVFSESVKVDFKREQAVRIINFLSGKRVKFGLSKKPLALTSQRINMVKSRLNETNFDDAHNVVRTRFIVWGNDDKFKQYLTIETLFRPSKYHKYVDEIEAIDKTVPKEFTAVESAIKHGNWTD